MDKQDELMHSEAAAAGPTGHNLKQVIRSLKETSYLSEFLDRLTQDATQIDQIVPPEQGERSPEMEQLAALQSDEEQITSGIETLLNSIKAGKPLHSLETHSTQPALDGSLEDRADAESKKLRELEKQLDDVDKANKPASSTPAAVVRVPLPKLQHQLSGYISAELDETLRKFKTMRDAGDTVDPALRAKIESYMSQITAHVLHTCVSYEQWNQPSAIQDELKAANSGDPEQLSQLHSGTHLASSKLVQTFLSNARPHLYHYSHVPLSLKRLMGQGVALPGVGKLVVHLP